MIQRTKMIWLPVLMLIFAIGLMPVPTTAQSVDEFVQALSPLASPTTSRPRGLGGIQAKKTRPQKAMYLHFALNSAELTPSSINTLNSLGQALRKQQLRNFTYRLEGHTCDRGSDALNMDLSRRRALSVRNYLVRQVGLPPDQIEVAWFGETRPAVPNVDEAARRKNRRVMIVNTLKPLTRGRLEIHRLRNDVESVVADGGTLTQSDSYAIEFKTADARYVYVFQKDTAGKLTPVFPNSRVLNLNNPLQPRAFYRIPARGKWFFLDENKGTEEIIMLTAPAPLPDPMVAIRNVIAGKLYASRTRGLGGIHRKKPRPAAAPAGSETAGAGQTVQSRPAPEVQVFKRYFRHE